MIEFRIATLAVDFVVNRPFPNPNRDPLLCSTDFHGRFRRKFPTGEDVGGSHQKVFLPRELKPRLQEQLSRVGGHNRACRTF